MSKVARDKTRPPMLFFLSDINTGLIFPSSRSGEPYSTTFPRADHPVSARTPCCGPVAPPPPTFVYTRDLARPSCSKTMTGPCRCCFLLSRGVPPPPALGVVCAAERSCVLLTMETEQAGGFVAARGFAAQGVCDAASGAPCSGRRVRRGAAERGVRSVACAWWVCEARTGRPPASFSRRRADV